MTDRSLQILQDLRDKLVSIANRMENDTPTSRYAESVATAFDEVLEMERLKLAVEEGEDG
jgi:phage tail tape-measure protein